MESSMVEDYDDGNEESDKGDYMVVGQAFT